MIISEERLAQIIFSARKGLGITQQDVAKKTGITQGALSKIEGNTCSVSAKHWFLLSDYLDIPHLVVNTGFIDRGVKPRIHEKNTYRLSKRYYEDAYSSVKDLIPFLSYIEQTMGKKKLYKFYEKVGIHHSYFVNLNNPINIEFLLDLLNYFYKSTALPTKIIDKVAEGAKVAAYHGVHHDTYTKKTNALALIKAYIDYGAYYDQNYKYRILKKTPKQLVFEMMPGDYLLNLEPAKQEIIDNLMIPYRKKYLENFSKLGDFKGVTLECKDKKNQATHFSVTLQPQ